MATDTSILETDNIDGDTELAAKGVGSNLAGAQGATAGAVGRGIDTGADQTVSGTSISDAASGAMPNAPYGMTSDAGPTTDPSAAGLGLGAEGTTTTDSGGLGISGLGATSANSIDAEANLGSGVTPGNVGNDARSGMNNGGESSGTAD